MIQLPIALTFLSTGIVMIFLGLVAKSQFAIMLGLIPITVVCLLFASEVNNWVLSVSASLAGTP